VCGTAEACGDCAESGDTPRVGVDQSDFTQLGQEMVCAEQQRVCAGQDADLFRGGLVSKAHRLCVSLNSRPERNKEEADLEPPVVARGGGPHPDRPLVEVGCKWVQRLQGYLSHKKHQLP